MSIDGKVGTFCGTGDSGEVVKRIFCPECGSPIFTEAASIPDVVFIKAGTLDDTSWLDPKTHIYCESKARWTSIPEDSQQFARMPI
jgi:hypothetical protein